MLYDSFVQYLFQNYTDWYFMPISTDPCIHIRTLYPSSEEKIATKASVILSFIRWCLFLLVPFQCVFFSPSHFSFYSVLHVSPFGLSLFPASLYQTHSPPCDVLHFYSSCRPSLSPYVHIICMLLVFANLMRLSIQLKFLIFTNTPPLPVFCLLFFQI